MSCGKMIVFEGIDGAGKSTQIELLANYLKEKGRRVYCTAEPTETVTGGLLRDALSGASKRSGCEMAALFVLDRIHHNINSVNGMQKLLSEGVDVICDRYYYSSLAYQGSETDFDWVAHMNLDCPEIRCPDLCLFLDLTPEQSMERISKGRVTKEIYETREKLEQVRNQFFHAMGQLKDRDRIVVVNAARSIDEIRQEIREVVDEVLGIN